MTLLEPRTRATLPVEIASLQERRCQSDGRGPRMDDCMLALKGKLPPRRRPEKRKKGTAAVRIYEIGASVLYAKRVGEHAAAGASESCDAVCRARFSHPRRRCQNDGRGPGATDCVLDLCTPVAWSC